MNSSLEFDKIKDKLIEYTSTNRAKERFCNMLPFLSEAELLKNLKETTEARKILDMQGVPPISHVDDIKNMTESADRGELLTISELGQIRQFCTLCMRLKRYLKKSEDMDFSISLFGRGMTELDILKEEIERCIRNERVDEQASKELKDIRRKKDILSNKIRAKLESILKSKKDYFSESFISNRNGHYTLPVKKEYKFMVSGAVIDISSSGATYFVEPTAVSKLKDELTILEVSESNEERKILYMLASDVCSFKYDILLNLEYVEELDYIFSKAKLSYDMKGIEPAITTDRELLISEGRHPFLTKTDCVPLNIELGNNNRGIVITGPNTGGKTVALKTVGLFSIMAQYGLHLPCKEAKICMNSQVLCDIGDGQSITENLSTFSSHIKNIIKITESLDSDTLVLLDELGSGTDPTEGMGIAIAVLEELRISGCNFIVTTHYPEVKEYADLAEGMINARMAFDRETLKPLYVLEMGQAGESCALYIAKRLGMPDKMLETAYLATYNDFSKSRINTANNNNSNMNADGNNSLKITFREPEVKHKEFASPIKKIKPEKLISQRAARFTIGDSVVMYPQKKIGIVFETANDKGEVGVQVKKEKLYVNHKRLQLKASAVKLYPENYDFSIIFDSVEVRKAKHDMSRKHMPGVEIKL